MLNYRLVFSLCLVLTSVAQTVPPSGDVTVRLTQSLDSANGRPTSAAVVVTSSNPAIASGSSAIVQIVRGQSGGLSVELVRLAVSGQTFRTTSSAGELAGGLMGQINRALQNSASGSRVLLTQGTDVRFTLAKPPSSPAQAAATPGWKVQDIKDGGHEALIMGSAESGGRHSKAALGISCTVRHFTDTGAAYASVDYELRIPSGVITFSTNDLGCEGGGGNNFARISLGDESGKEAGFCYDGELPRAPNQTVQVQIVPEDPKLALKSAGTFMQVALRLPNTAHDAMVARFLLPQDAVALESITDPCFQILDEEARKEQAAVVVTCPNIPGKKLQDVSVLTGPSMAKLQPDPDNDSGMFWVLPKKTSRKATLACYYGTGAQAEKKLLPIPPAASYCVFRKDGHCSTSEGSN
jgi:hypothetical protein